MVLILIFFVSLFPYLSSISLLSQSKSLVICDIDDTIVSSGGISLFGYNFGGVDKQYKRGFTYPGVFEFIFQLSLNQKFSSENQILYYPDNVTLLTARPAELKRFLGSRKINPLQNLFDKTGLFYFIDFIYSLFQYLGIDNGFSSWGVESVYYGSISDWISPSQRAIRKKTNFDTIFTSHKVVYNDKISYILIGDVGEYDEEAYKLIANQYPDSIKAIFLHIVGSSDEEEEYIDYTYQNIPIIYFRTYSGAAMKAYKYNLMTIEGVSKVFNSSINLFLTE